ncbi:MAG: hypothetical protein HY300_14905 [Verrucomicrobia bacterium]|nr:hypothetical protein [Verrucomicrobiota bacterium]
MNSLRLFLASLCRAIWPSGSISRGLPDQPLTRPSATLSPSDGERDGVRGRRLFVSVLLVFVLCGHSFSAESAAPPKGERVFVTAHSFHIFVAPRLAALAKAAGIEGHVLVGQQMIGGSKVIQHWNLPDDKNKAKAALAAGEVDVLTMSPHVYLPDEGIDRFVELGAQHNPKMRFLVQHSWTPWDGWVGDEKVANNDERDTRPLDKVRVANKRFRDLLETQITALNKKLGRDAISIVPVGDAVMKLRELVAAGKAPGLAKQTDLFTDQIGHGKAPIIALATYCNFACIYRVSPVGLKDNDPALDKISPELKPLLQQIAWETVSTYPMSGVSAPKPSK